MFFGWGERRRKIAGAVTLVVKQELRKKSSPLGTISLTMKELHQKTKDNLPDKFALATLQILNAIRKDAELSKHYSIAPTNGVEYVTLYSSEMNLALELVRNNLSREENPATVLNFRFAA